MPHSLYLILQSTLNSCVVDVSSAHCACSKHCFQLNAAQTPVHRDFVGLVGFVLVVLYKQSSDDTLIFLIVGMLGSLFFKTSRTLIDQGLLCCQGWI